MAHTVRKVLVIAASVAGLMGAGAGTAVADHGDDDFGFDDHGRFGDHRFFDDRGFDCFGPFCFVIGDRHGGPGRHSATAWHPTGTPCLAG